MSTKVYVQTTQGEQDLKSKNPIDLFNKGIDVNESNFDSVFADVLKELHFGYNPFANDGVVTIIQFTYDKNGYSQKKISINFIQ